MNILTLSTLLTALVLSACASHPVSAYPNKGFYAQKYKDTGIASYYADRFHGRTTANGEKFDMHAMTAAHKKLKFGTWVEVTNLTNGKQVKVRINDRGPYARGRIIDLSKAAAQEVGLIKPGLAKVKIKIIDPVN